jgi:ribosomal protein S18 acetylase RimI-like enzyme
MLLRALHPQRRPAPMTPQQLERLTLRDATAADLQALAELHVRTFNETHLGPFGSGPSVALRVSQWRDKLEDQHATNFVIVIQTPERELVGFAWVHPTSGDSPFDVRLNKIYLRREYQRQKLGRAMMRAIADRLLASSVRSMVLFTETDNAPACAFYDSLGGERVRGDEGEWGGMYAWRDLDVLKAKLR